MNTQSLLNRLTSTLFGTCLLFALAFSAPVKSQTAAEMFAEENFSASVWLTSDYIFRGVSFSDQGPAIQASLDWGYNSFYAGVWGTNLELTAYDNKDDDPKPNNRFSSIELDWYIGYANTLADWLDYDLMGIYYQFPRDKGHLESDYFEIWLTLSHTFDMPLSPTVGVFGAWSPDFSYEEGNAIYTKLFGGIAFENGFGIDAAFGTQEIDGEKDAFSGGKTLSYSHWEFGINKTVAGFGLDLRYHDSDEQKSYVDLYLGNASLMDERVVFSISR